MADKKSKKHEEKEINEKVDFTEENTEKEETENIVEEEINSAIKVNEILIKLENEKEEYINALKRERADFENYKKRNADLSATSYANGTADVLTSFISVLDNFERAMSAESTDTSFYDGMNMIMRQILDVFSSYGIEEINTNCEFNPNLHNAVVQVEEEGQKSNYIAEVLQKGYIFKDRILRHAMVKVYK